MSLSEDEDDFLSADEDVLCEDQNKTLYTPKILMIEEKDSSVTSSLMPKKVSVIESKETKSKHVQSAQAGTSGIKDVKFEKSIVNEETSTNDEEALAERIRERNLKLARKFSVELAKNVKASAPIPVKTPISTSYILNDSLASPENFDSSKVNEPPAPPPTPSLSSSFSSSDPPYSQYGWRIPIKTESLFSRESPVTDLKSEQAKQALDKLSERLNQSEKNLFERVAEDIKKVSLKTSLSTNDSSKSNEAPLPLISDIGSSLSGWNWNSASKLLATASQVKSQVGSVIESVVNVAHQTVQEVPKQAPIGIITKPESTKESLEENCKSSAQTNESNINQVLVGYTLGAMESLGKKAFGVMTERDDFGSLQIKGLGRPWEHLLNGPKSHQQQPKQDDPNLDDVCTETLDMVGKSSDITCKIENQHMSLKNRKRRANHRDDEILH